MTKTGDVETVDKNIVDEVSEHPKSTKCADNVQDDGQSTVGRKELGIVTTHGVQNDRGEEVEKWRT